MFKSTLLFIACLGCSLALQCCVPDTWEGVQQRTASTLKNGKPTISTTTIKVHYDLSNFQAAFDETVTANGYTVKAKVIQKYKDSLEYVITGNTCTKKPIASTPQNRCLPSTATLEGRHFIHSGKNNVSYNTYLLKMDNVTATVSMTDECIPIQQIIYGSTPSVQYFLSDSYFDITTGIKDHSVFNIPASCSKAILVKNTQQNMGVFGR